MRSVGGAFGLACALGCASAWKPPPEPPPFVETPSTSPPSRSLEWDAGARSIGCGPTDFTVPADLAAHVRMNGPDELVIVPPGSPPGSALMARAHDPRRPPKRPVIDGGLVGILDWSVEQLAERATLGYEYMAMLRLYALARGQSPEALANEYDAKNGKNGKKDSLEATMKDDFVEISYNHSDETWRLVGIDSDRCAIMAVQRVFPRTTDPFAAIKEQMRAAARSFSLARGY